MDVVELVFLVSDSEEDVEQVQEHRVAHHPLVQPVGRAHVHGETPQERDPVDGVRGPILPHLGAHDTPICLPTVGPMDGSRSTRYFPEVSLGEDPP